MNPLLYQTKGRVDALKTQGFRGNALLSQYQTVHGRTLDADLRVAWGAVHDDIKRSKHRNDVEQYQRTMTAKLLSGIGPF